MSFFPALRRRCRRRGLAFAIGAAAMLLAAATGSAAPTASDRDTVARIESWLNGMRTLKSPFIQTSSNGGVAEGVIWLQRPGRMRIDYRPPTPLQVYTDGMWLVYVDTELKEVNQVPLSATPAAYLVREKIALSGDVTVERVTRRRGTVSLHLTQSEDAEAGRLIVTFAEEPLELRGWTVVDAQGIETTVTLVGPSINAALDEDVFDFPAPDWAPKQPE